MGRFRKFMSWALPANFFAVLLGGVIYENFILPTHKIDFDIQGSKGHLRVFDEKARMRIYSSSLPLVYFDDNKDGDLDSQAGKKLEDLSWEPRRQMFRRAESIYDSLQVMYPGLLD